jgi:hypothetical protein
MIGADRRRRLLGAVDGQVAAVAARDLLAMVPDDAVGQRRVELLA